MPYTSYNKIKKMLVQAMSMSNVRSKHEKYIHKI